MPDNRADSNRRRYPPKLTQPRIAGPLSPMRLTEARRDMLLVAKDHSPAAMLKICEMGGLVPGKAPAESEAVRFAACVEVLNRAHGRPHITLHDENAQPLVVDFRWQDEPSPRLLEAEPGD